MMTARSVLAFATVVVMSAANPSSAQQITTRSSEPLLVLPETMAVVLQRFDPEFHPRRLKDYPPFLWRRPCSPVPDCTRFLYRPDARQAPFAVIGDFNGDRILDVVIDGDNRTTGRRIVLLSSRAGVQVTEIDQLSRIPPSVEASRDNPAAFRSDDEDGVSQGLSRVRPGTYKSSFETSPLVLTTDAFMETFYGKAAAIRYYRGGRWLRYVIAD
jgi:hypothetical protein